MATITTRAGKGTPLTNAEVDANFTNLNDFKVEQTAATGSAKVPTGTQSQRDATPEAGLFRFNTDTESFEGYNGTEWGAVGGSAVNGTSRRFRYIATAGQTTFTGFDSNSNLMAYDVGYVDVYLNGVRLDQTDYTASSGTSIVLAAGAALDDELNIVAFGVFSVATHVVKSGDTMTGPLVLSGNPTIALEAATKQYVDAIPNPVAMALIFGG